MHHASAREAKQLSCELVNVLCTCCYSSHHSPNDLDRLAGCGGTERGSGCKVHCRSLALRCNQSMYVILSHNACQSSCACLFWPPLRSQFSVEGQMLDQLSACLLLSTVQIVSLAPMASTGKQPAYLPVTATVCGHNITALKRNIDADEDDAAGLTWFDFDSDNAIAQSTGTLLWDASYAIVELLTHQQPLGSTGASLQQLLSGRRVLELGAGIGFSGLCCAAAGAHMCLSDLPSIVDGILGQNISRNVSPSPQHSTADTATTASCSGTPWPTAQPCGRGTVTAIPVDFCKDLNAQVCRGCDPRDAQVVLAADIIWLKELVRPLAATIAAILRHNSQHSSSPAYPTQPASLPESSQHRCDAPSANPADSKKLALLAFGERATAESKLFVSLDEVCDAFRQQGCNADLAVRKTIERLPGERMQIAVLCITV